MPGDNTSKEWKKSSGEALNKPDNTGDSDDNEKSERLNQKLNSIRYNEFKLEKLDITNFCIDCNKEVLKPFLRCKVCNNKKLKKGYFELIREFEKKELAKIKLTRKLWIKTKKENDFNFKIICLLRNRLSKQIIKYIKTGKILINSNKYGIDYEAIINHLKPFPEDLSKYHIHHIKPLTKFNFVNDDGSINLEEVRKAFAPENHIFLLIEDHRKLNHRNL